MVKKYRRYRNALEKFLASDTGRRFFHIAYSVGAAVVVLAALFKINHYPLGNELMIVGLGSEAFIFLLSAFDSPVREYPWEEVFPEFATPEQLEQKKYYEERRKQREAEKIASEETEEFSTPQSVVSNVTTYYPSSNLSSQGEMSSTSQGEHSSQTGNITIVSGISGGNGVSTIPAVEGFESTSVQTTPSSDGRIPAGFTPDMASASENYIAQVNRMSDNVEKFNELTQSLNQMSDVLVSSFKHISDNSEGIGVSTKGYVSQMENLNRNISGLNTIYEIQLKGVSSQINAIDQINSGLDRIKNLYEGSIPDSSVFRAETEKLAQQLKDLNMVYARMLQAMTVNMGMGGNLSGYTAPTDPNRD